MRRRKKSPWVYEVAILDDDDEQTGEWETCKVVNRFDDGTLEIVCKDDEEESFIVNAEHVREKQKKKKKKNKPKKKEKKQDSKNAAQSKSPPPEVVLSESIDPPKTSETPKNVICKDSDATEKSKDSGEPVIKESNQDEKQAADVEDANKIEEIVESKINSANVHMKTVHNETSEIDAENQPEESNKHVVEPESEKKELEQIQEAIPAGKEAETSSMDNELDSSNLEARNDFEVQETREADATEDVVVEQSECRAKVPEVSDAIQASEENESSVRGKQVSEDDQVSGASEKKEALNQHSEKEEAAETSETEENEKTSIDAIKEAVKQELEILEAPTEAARDNIQVEILDSPEMNEAESEEPVQILEGEEAKSTEVQVEKDIVAGEITERAEVVETSEEQQLEIQENELESTDVEQKDVEESKEAEIIGVDEIIESVAAETEELKIQEIEVEIADVEEDVEESKETEKESLAEAQQKVELEDFQDADVQGIEDEVAEAVVCETAEDAEVARETEIQTEAIEAVMQKISDTSIEASIDVPDIITDVQGKASDVINDENAVLSQKETNQASNSTEAENFGSEEDLEIKESQVKEKRISEEDLDIKELQVHEKSNSVDDIVAEDSTETEPIDDTNKQNGGGKGGEESQHYTEAPEQMMARLRPNIRWVCEVEVLSDGASIGDWLPCNIAKENKDGSYDIQCNAGLVHYIPAEHVRTVPIQWTHEVLEIEDGEVEWNRCIILDGEAGENNVKIHVENQTLNKEVRTDKVRPIEMYWTHEMAALKQSASDWLKCIVLAKEEDGFYTVHCEDGSIWDEVSQGILRPVSKEWTHEYQILLHGIQTDQWRQCIILNEESDGEAATVHSEEGFIEVVESHLLRSLYPEEIAYTHKVATFTESGDTAEWWPCFIEEVLENGNIRVECENGVYDVSPEHVLSIQDAPENITEESKSQISKLHQSPSNKAWYSTVSLVTVRGYDGKMYNFPEGTRVLITDFEGDTVKIEEPVFGWTHLYSDDHRFLFQFEEDWVKSVLSGKSWYDIFGEVKTRILDYSASFESSRVIEPTKYEVIGSNGCTIREEYALTSPKLEKLAKGSVMEIVEMKGRRARILRPREGWISMHSIEGVWFIEKVSENEPSDQENESDEEEIEVEPSVVGLDQFEDSDDPEFLQLKKDWLVLKQANILQNRQLVSKDKKLLRLKKQLKTRTRKTYGVHSNFWEELGAKQRRRNVIQREIRSKNALNETLRKELEQKRVVYDEKQDILNLLTAQRDELRARVVNDKLRQETALQEHLWKNKYGALEDGVRHLAEQKDQLEEFHKELLDEIEAKRGALQALQDARDEFSKKAQIATKERENNKARIDMASSWRRQLRRKLRGLRKVRQAQMKDKPMGSPTISERSSAEFPQSPEPMPSEI